MHYISLNKKAAHILLMLLYKTCKVYMTQKGIEVASYENKTVTNDKI